MFPSHGTRRAAERAAQSKRGLEAHTSETNLLFMSLAIVSLSAGLKPRYLKYFYSQRIKNGI